LTAIQCEFYAPRTTIQRSHIDSFFTASGKTGFTRRIVVSTSDRWSKHAEDALADQQVSTQRLDISSLSESVVDWGGFSWHTPSVLPTYGPKTLRPHQEEALAAVRAGFEQADRGKLIMACGTGKTFTSLKIAEDLVDAGGTVLFLVPSISLLSQTLREWMQEATVPLRPFAVCSDVRAGRRQTEDMGVVDLAEPATTSAAKLIERMARSSNAGRMTVVFSTYQSIQAVADAQRLGLADFDLVVCDEAHRTTAAVRRGLEDQGRREHGGAGIDGRRVPVRGGVPPARVRRRRRGEPAVRLQGARARGRREVGLGAVPGTTRRRKQRDVPGRRREDRGLLERPV